MPQIKFSVWITRSTLPVWDCWSISLHNGYLIISLGLELITNVWILLDISFPTLREVSKTPAPLLTYQQSVTSYFIAKLGFIAITVHTVRGRGWDQGPLHWNLEVLILYYWTKFSSKKMLIPPPPQKIALWLKNKFTPLLPLGKFVFWICPCILIDIQWRDSFTPY